MADRRQEMELLLDALEERLVRSSRSDVESLFTDHVADEVVAESGQTYTVEVEAFWEGPDDVFLVMSVDPSGVGPWPVGRSRGLRFDVSEPPSERIARRDGPSRETNRCPASPVRWMTRLLARAWRRS